MRPFRVLPLVAALALAGCGGKNPSSPAPSGGTLADFEALVQSSYAGGAVLPTNLDATASLLVTMDSDGRVVVGAAIFQSGGGYVDAGTVTVFQDPGGLEAGQVDTLARRSVVVDGTPDYVYSSVPNLPNTLPIVCDGTSWHHFVVSGSARFTPFADSLRSVARPSVSAPGPGAQQSRSADLTVTWTDAGLDSTLYVQCMVRSETDSTRSVLGMIARDEDGGSTVAASRLGTLPAGAARLSVGRYRIVRRTGARIVDMVCEGVTLREITLD